MSKIFDIRNKNLKIVKKFHRNKKRFCFELGKFLIQNYRLSIARNPKNFHIKSIKIKSRLPHTKNHYEKPSKKPSKKGK